MLFKWAIPWSDRVYNAFSRVKPALCRADAQRGAQRAAPTLSGSLPALPWPPYTEESPQGIPNTVKQQRYFCLCGKKRDLVAQFLPMRKNRDADRVVIYQQKRCSHHSPVLLLCRAKWKWYLHFPLHGNDTYISYYMEMIPSFSALLFHMKN